MQLIPATLAVLLAVYALIDLQHATAASMDISWDNINVLAVSLTVGFVVMIHSVNSAMIRLSWIRLTYADVLKVNLSVGILVLLAPKVA